MPDIGLLGFAVFVGIILIWIWNSLYIIKEWERGVVLRLGRLLPEAKGAGVRLVFWPVETLYRINLRLETLDVPPQDIITRDNVSVKVNAVCYFRVVDANLAMSQVQNYQYATSQLAQTTLRSIVGQFELDEILSQRDKVNAKLQIILDQDTEPWGDCTNVGSPFLRRVFASAMASDSLVSAATCRLVPPPAFSGVATLVFEAALTCLVELPLFPTAGTCDGLTAGFS